MMNLPTFALFGLTTQIYLINSNISVNVPQNLLKGALLCLECDITALATDFEFVASGINISGMILTSKTNLQINQSLMKSRLTGVNVAGLILDAPKMSISLIDCNISGYDVQTNISGALIAFISGNINLVVNIVQICSNDQKFGQGADKIFKTGTILLTCIICREQYYSYGLCQNSLYQGNLENSTLKCTEPFKFDGNECSCPEGEVVNGSACANILSSINQLVIQQEQIPKSTYSILLQTELTQNITTIVQQDVNLSHIQIQILYKLSNITGSSVLTNSTLVQQFILNNMSTIDQNILNTMSVIDQRILNNASNLNNIIQNLNISLTKTGQNVDLMNKSISAQVDINVALNQSIQNITRNISTFNQELSEQQKMMIDLDLLTECLNNPDQFNIFGKCYVVSSEDSSRSCSQKYFVSTFDIQQITNYVSIDDFGVGYIFSTSNVISNAFIDVSDNTYTSIVQPLFQTQSNFENIKIQLGVQDISGGSILTTSNRVIIKQMSIISKTGCQITVSSEDKLNILYSSSSNTSINNLFVHLSFAQSRGNISLIGIVSSYLYINCYQVTGIYNSKLTVSMICLTLSAASVTVNQVCFKPSVYQVGNCSSYLFSSVSFTSSIELSNISFILGNRSISQTLSSISTVSSTTFYQFGGLVAISNANSFSIVMNYVMYDCHQFFSTNYVSISGFIVGQISSTSSIDIKNMCLQQTFTSASILFQIFGLFGESTANTIIQQSCISFTTQGSFKLFGIIGYSTGSSQLSNVKTYVSVINSGSSIGSLIGFVTSQLTLDNVSSVTMMNCTMNIGGFIGLVGTQNVTIINSEVSGIINASNSVGGFIGRQSSGSNVTIANSNAKCNISAVNINVGGVIGYMENTTNATILNSKITKINISAQYSVGGFIGWCEQCSLTIMSSIIEYSHIFGKTQNYGIVSGGINQGSFNISSSSANFNYLNNVMMNCQILTNNWSVTQCQ
ncbi:Conserved_hypothetical protein [Hexamita inflata]|uniref:Uncharacterized protein n=1 Tax=Hexamita inflata TaxID=28002 RepID=A0AA86U0S3_9EUKA|nr:Conserved hypothetical protein [Hexamita inflata]